jgi:hypothetical protein
LFSFLEVSLRTVPSCLQKTAARQFLPHRPPNKKHHSCFLFSFTGGFTKDGPLSVDSNSPPGCSAPKKKDVDFTTSFFFLPLLFWSIVTTCPTLKQVC